MPKPFSILSFILLAFLMAKNSYAQTEHKLKAVEVRNINPLFGETFYRVFRVGDLVAYQSHYFFDSSASHHVFDSSINDFITVDTVVLSESRKTFFIFCKDSSYGYSYDPHDPFKNNKRLKVDSILNGIRGGNTFEQLLAKTPDSSEWNQGKTILQEVFCFPATDTTPSGRIILTYSRDLNSISESLNKFLDSVKGMKLFKTEFFINEFYDKKNQKQWPAMKLDATEIKEVEVENDDEIWKFIKRYKRKLEWARFSNIWGNQSGKN